MHNTVRLQFDYMHAYIFIHNSKIAKYIESNVSVYIKKNVLVTYLKWMNKFMKNHRNGLCLLFHIPIFIVSSTSLIFVQHMCCRGVLAVLTDITGACLDLLILDIGLARCGP